MTEPDLRAAMRSSMQESFTARAMVDSGAPILTFALAVPFSSVRLASYLALGVGLLLALERLVRRRPLQQVVAGLLGLGLAVFIANRTGKASGFYLPGIIQTCALAVVLLVSLAVRRPLIGAVVGAVWEPAAGWRHRPVLRRALTRVTVVAAAWYTVKASIQTTLYVTDHATGLAGARLAMGLPPYLLLLAYGVTSVRRAVAEEAAAAKGPVAAEATGTDPGEPSGPTTRTATG